MIQPRLVVLLVALLSFTSFPAASQDAAITPPVISAANIANLRSVKTIDFANGFIESSVSTPVISEFDTGWFVMAPDASQFAVMDSAGALFPIDSGGSLYPAGVIDLPARDDAQTFIDGAFTLDGTFVYATANGESYAVFYNHLAAEEAPASVSVTSPDRPVHLWLDCADGVDADCHAWLEMEPADPAQAAYVIQMPSPNEIAAKPALAQPGDSDLHPLPYAPSQDKDAVVRISRIPSPYVITSTLDGLVKLWDIQTGEVTGQAHTSNDQPAAFGQIDNAGTHLAWRDQASAELHVMDFETGEDRMIAPLEGQYVQWFFVTDASDVVIAVNIGLQPIVVAWDATTGERYDLGPYRQCNRVPDKARLSQDGTTLVIGCDTGLDIWQVVAGS